VPGAGDAWDRLRAPSRGFIPIDDVTARAVSVANAGAATGAMPVLGLAEPSESWDSRSTLFGDGDR